MYKDYGLPNGPGVIGPETGQAAEGKFIEMDRRGGIWRADSARNRDHGGSGLGLAICEGIIDTHEGRIWV